MKVKSKGWALLAGLLVLLVSSSALAGSVARQATLQNSFVCVNIHNGLIKVISRRQHNRCASGWKRYRVSDIFGKGMKGAKGAALVLRVRVGRPVPPALRGATGATGSSGATGATGPQGFMGLQGLIGPDLGRRATWGPWVRRASRGRPVRNGANGLDGATGQAGGLGTNGGPCRCRTDRNGQDGATGPAGPNEVIRASLDRKVRGDSGLRRSRRRPRPDGSSGSAGADGLNGSSVITATGTSTVVDANAIVTATATCPADHIAISGGFLEAGATSPSVIESHATPAFAGWVAKAKTQGNSQQSVSLTRLRLLRALPRTRQGAGFGRPLSPFATSRGRPIPRRPRRPPSSRAAPSP